MWLESVKEWLALNERTGKQLFHQTGLLVLSKDPVTPDSFEGKSLVTQHQRGVPVSMLDRQQVAQQFPQWRQGKFEAYVNHSGGWAESEQCVLAFLDEARQLGVKLVRGRVAHLCYDGVPSNPKIAKGRCIGVRLTASSGTGYSELLSDVNGPSSYHIPPSVNATNFELGQFIKADQVVVSAGAWTPTLVPSVSESMWPTAIIVFHFQPHPTQIARYSEAQFPAYCADISQSGFYGFPAHPVDGRIKVGKHDKGYPLHGVEPTPAVIEALRQSILQPEEAKFRNFLRENLPELADAPTLFSRVCLYCDTFDGDFIIDRHPQHQGLIVASGGSGHGFKFAPVIGKIIADVAQNQPNKYQSHFRWRSPSQRFLQEKRESSRSDGFSPIAAAAAAEVLRAAAKEEAARSKL
jgi:glycine/D-amino acid oxidase-like deaminating enzyme